MKLTDDIFRALQRAINSLGVDEAAKSANVKSETLLQFLNHSTDIVRKETWDKIYPMLIKPYMPPSDKNDPSGLPVPPSHARVHRDLASLSSDEKILLDAFNDLTPELQQQKLMEIVELAREVLAANKTE